MIDVRSWFSRALATFRKDHSGHLQDEINEHIDMLAEDYVRRGMSPDEARFAARREMGNITAIAQRYREQKGLPLLENFWQDLKFAVRTLRRSPVYTASCTATLAVGLASMITVLSVVSALLWRPLPYPSPERLVVIKQVDPRGGAWPFTEPDLLDVQQRSQSLAAVAAFHRGVSALTGSGDPETVQSAAVTPSSFALFGIKPIVGHVFQDSPKDVVIGRRLWKRKFQMNPAVVGQAVMLDGERYTIAGIADLPSELLPGTELLVPLLPRATESRSAHEIEAVGRIRAGVETGQAQSELNTIAASIARQNPQTHAGWGMRLMHLSEYIVGPRTGRVVWMIFAAVALLWVLACANVAGLQIARSIGRRHEMSTRLALGAGTLRLFAQTLTEGIVLAFIGSLIGVTLAGYAIDAIRSLAAESMPQLAGLQMNATIIGIALGCLLISTVLCTLFSGRPGVLQGGREISRRDRGRDALIVAQVALASILLLAASLLLHSFVRLRSVDPGFDVERTLSVHVNLPSTFDDARRAAFFRDVTGQLARLPEVESVGATNVAPFSGQGTANRFRLEGEPALAEYRAAAWRAVTPGFFPALGIALKRGRLFDERDRDGSTEVIILSESMAKEFWPNQDPLGKRLLWGRSRNPKTIVGIVGDLRDLAVDAPPVPTMFRPFAQLTDAPMTLVIRTKGDPVSAVADARRGIWSVDPNVALDFQPLRRALSDSIMRPRVSLLTFAAFAAIAMITAAFGLYGLISYRVNQRQQEIGIRLALGCPTGAVRWGVQKRCMMLVGMGLAIGLPTAYALSTLMTSLLFETQRMQPSAYAMVLLVFVTVALMASWGPARRASRMDPAAAIRYE